MMPHGPSTTMSICMSDRSSSAHVRVPAPSQHSDARHGARKTSPVRAASVRGTDPALRAAPDEKVAVCLRLAAPERSKGERCDKARIGGLSGVAGAAVVGGCSQRGDPDAVAGHE